MYISTVVLLIFLNGCLSSHPNENKSMDTNTTIAAIDTTNSTGVNSTIIDGTNNTSAVTTNTTTAVTPATKSMDTNTTIAAIATTNSTGVNSTLIDGTNNTTPVTTNTTTVVTPATKSMDTNTTIAAIATTNSTGVNSTLIDGTNNTTAVTTNTTTAVTPATKSMDTNTTIAAIATTNSTGVNSTIIDGTNNTTAVTTNTTTAVTPATTAVTKPSKAPIQIWLDSTVYYKLSPSFTHHHIKKINRVIAFIEYRTCIRFKKVSEKEKVRSVLVITGEGQRCSSELGWNRTWRQFLVLEIGIVTLGCFVYVKLLELFLRMLGFEGLTSYDYRIWEDRLGLRKKHLKKLNKMDAKEEPLKWCPTLCNNITHCKKINIH